MKTAADFRKEAAKAAKISKYKPAPTTSPKEAALKATAKPIEKKKDAAKKAVAMPVVKTQLSTVRLYPILVDAVVAAIARIFRKDEYADKVIPDLLKRNLKWGARDRNFVAETAYDLVRWWRKYWAALDMSPNFDDGSVQKVIALSLLSRGYSILNPELLGIENLSFLQKLLYQKHENPAIEYALPDWLYARILKNYQDDSQEVAELLHALNQSPQVYLRVNTLKTTKQQLVKQFEKDEISTASVEDVPDALSLTTRKNLQKNALYLNGHFEFQDLGSQRIGAFCKVKKGMTVIDVCAGGGGKSLYIAANMQNKGQLIASDLHTHRLAQLHIRAERAGINILKIKKLEELNAYNHRADVVLLDVPCSGLGVLRRNADTKWKLKETDLDALLVDQATILQQHASLPCVGGALVYATCSILAEESELQVAAFLQKNKNYMLENAVRIHPHRDDCDGFYMARLIRSF